MYVGTIAEVENSQKKPEREQIYFTDPDLPKELLSHMNSLVVAMDINGMVVHQVLVEIDISENVL